MLGGPSGAGKTFSSLKLAHGFMGSYEKVVIIDTEDSADVYDRFGDYTVMDFKPPHLPERYIKAIDLCIDEGFEFIIIDSITKAWDECLKIHGAMSGNSFTNWAKVTPRWDSFLQHIVHAPSHIIACTRKKQEYALNQEGNRTKVEKMGMKNQLREGAEYEVTLALDIEMNHNCFVNKDRTGIFEEICPVILKEEHGKLLKDWCEGK